MKIVGDGSENKGNGNKKKLIIIGGAITALVLIVGGSILSMNKPKPTNLESNTQVAKKAGVKYTKEDYEKDKKAGPLVGVKDSDKNKKQAAKGRKNSAKKNTKNYSDEAKQKSQKAAEATSRANKDKLSSASQQLLNKSQKAIDNYAGPLKDNTSWQSTGEYKPIVSDVAKSIVDQTQAMHNFAYNQYLGYPTSGQYQDASYDGVRNYNLQLLKYAQNGTKPSIKSFSNSFDDQVALIRFDLYNNDYQFTGIGDDSTYYKSTLKNYVKQGVFALDQIDTLYLTDDTSQTFDGGVKSMLKADISSNGKNYTAYLTYNETQDQGGKTVKQYKILDIYKN